MTAAGTSGNGASGMADISMDGRYVVFESAADDLALGDTNGFKDIFLRDRLTGQTEIISRPSPMVQANGDSVAPSMSVGGHYIVYSSFATNLVPGDVEGEQDVFFYNRRTGRTIRVSAGGSEDSFNPTISENGRYIAFESLATNLVPDDTNHAMDVFHYDVELDVMTRVSVDSAGNQANAGSGIFGERPSYPSISDDGDRVVFTSLASNLVPNDVNGTWDVFLHDLRLRTTQLVSVDSLGIQGNDQSVQARISNDGKKVVFVSLSSNLVLEDTNDAFDVFVRDLVDEDTRRVSLSSVGTEGFGDSGLFATISAHGRTVAYATSAGNLAPGDTNRIEDIVVHDLLARSTSRVSLSSLGVEADLGSLHPVISADGRTVVFSSKATNLALDDRNGLADVFVHERGSDYWRNYGEGLAGTFGVPALQVFHAERLGMLTIWFQNDAPSECLGILVGGFQFARIPMPESDLLVQPKFFLPMIIPRDGLGTSFHIPTSLRMPVTFYLQGIEEDPSIPRGYCMTRGLEINLF